MPVALRAFVASASLGSRMRGKKVDLKEGKREFDDLGGSGCCAARKKGEGAVDRGRGGGSLGKGGCKFSLEEVIDGEKKKKKPQKKRSGWEGERNGCRALGGEKKKKTAHNRQAPERRSIQERVKLLAKKNLGGSLCQEGRTGAEKKER